MKKLIYTSLFALLVTFSANAQKVLTLDECINIALDNNINIKTARNNAISARAGYFQSKMNFLPSLGAGASHNWFEGLSFDQTSGGLVNTTTLSGGGSVNANLTIFNGFQNVLTMQQSKLQYEASEKAIEGSIQSTEAQVVAQFLNVIQTEENLKIQQQTKDLLQEQLSREEKREAAGIGNMEQVYNFRSQVAAQNLQIVNIENQLESAKLALIQLLLLNPADNYDFAGITASDAELEQEIEEYGSIYDRSLSYSPSLKSAELNLEASKKSLKMAQYGWMPSLTMGASYGTNWSSNVKARDANGDVILPLRVEDLNTQFDNNITKSARFNLNIPIFSRFQNRTNVQQSKILMLNSELNVEQAKNTLTNSVQQAYLNLVNAKSSYRAALESMESLNTSFDFAKNRYESGTIDFVTYLQSLNAKNRGEFELVRSKYGILFRQLIIEIFTGELKPGEDN